MLATFNPHRHKSGTLLVHNHLGKEPGAGPNLGLLLKAGVEGNLGGEEERTVTSVVRKSRSHLCVIVQLVQSLMPLGPRPLPVTGRKQLFGMTHLRNHPSPSCPYSYSHPRRYKKPYDFGFFGNGP